jgi:hypothetical protein
MPRLLKHGILRFLAATDAAAATTSDTGVALIVCLHGFTFYG